MVSSPRFTKTTAAEHSRAGTIVGSPEGGGSDFSRSRRGRQTRNPGTNRRIFWTVHAQNRATAVSTIADGSLQQRAVIWIVGQNQRHHHGPIRLRVPGHHEPGVSGLAILGMAVLTVGLQDGVNVVLEHRKIARSVRRRVRRRSTPKICASPGEQDRRQKAKKHADRVGSPPAVPAAYHRGRVWEPFQGSHLIRTHTSP